MASSSTGIAASGAADTRAALPFRSPAEHLLAELDCLKLLLHRQVLRLRASTLLREDQFRGLYISDEEVDAILIQNSPDPDPAESGASNRLLFRGTRRALARFPTRSRQHSIVSSRSHFWPLALRAVRPSHLCCPRTRQPLRDALFLRPE